MVAGLIVASLKTLKASLDTNLLKELGLKARTLQTFFVPGHKKKKL